jgi:hypothetical protein
MGEIKEVNGWWWIINANAFHAYPFPTRSDAEEILAAVHDAERRKDIPNHGDLFLFSGVSLSSVLPVSGGNHHEERTG